MSASNFQADLYQLRQSGDAAILNPGAGGTFNLRGRDLASVMLTATGTYTLPNSPFGTTLLVGCDDSSTITLADSTGTIAVFTGTSGGTVRQCVATDSNTWRVFVPTAGTAITDLAHSATEIAFDDNNSLTTEGDVGGALDELYYHFFQPSQGHVDIPLTCFREVDADGDVPDASVGAADGSGGVLASDTTPILEGVGTTNANRINWATTVVDRIAASVTLPPDFDGTAACTVDLICASAGTTNDFDATIVTNWNGGADVTDTVVDTAAVAVHASSATVAAADIPDAPLCVTVSLTPPAHATDAFYLYGARIRYTRKINVVA
jgi:hypothetical protein